MCIKRRTEDIHTVQRESYKDAADPATVSPVLRPICSSRCTSCLTRALAISTMDTYRHRSPPVDTIISWWQRSLALRNILLDGLAAYRENNRSLPEEGVRRRGIGNERTKASRAMKSSNVTSGALFLCFRYRWIRNAAGASTATATINGRRLPDCHVCPQQLWTCLRPSSSLVC